MKIVRVHEGKEIYYGELKDNMVYKIEGELFGDFTVTNRSVPLADVKLLAPCTPSKVVAIGKNYMDHINEMAAMAKPELPEEPEVFLKPPSGIIAPGEDIIYPEGAKRVDYEAEIAVVIGDVLHRSSVGVAGGFGDPQSRLAHLRPQPLELLLVEQR